MVAEREAIFEFPTKVTSSSVFYIKEQIIYHTIDTTKGGDDTNNITIITSGTLSTSSGGYTGTVPQNPYLLSGFVYNVDGAIQANETVRAYNKTNKEFITVTTNSDGYYIIDCANFPSGFANADVIELTAGLATRAYRATIDSDTNFTGGSEPESIRFQLSADGGRNWQDALVGEEVTFIQNGADLRWRAIANKDVRLIHVRINYDTQL